MVSDERSVVRSRTQHPWLLVIADVDGRPLTWFGAWSLGSESEPDTAVEYEAAAMIAVEATVTMPVAFMMMVAADLSLSLFSPSLVLSCSPGGGIGEWVYIDTQIYNPNPTQQKHVFGRR